MSNLLLFNHILVFLDMSTRLVDRKVHLVPFVKVIAKNKREMRILRVPVLQGLPLTLHL